jgi:hypothetical protein
MERKEKVLRPSFSVWAERGAEGRARQRRTAAEADAAASGPGAAAAP